MREQVIQQEIRIAISSPNVRMFRNNVGSIKDKDGRLVTFGLCKGSSDLIGFKSVEITPDMVGKSLAVFTAIEIKTPKGKISESQQAFIDMVKAKGGLAGVARSISDAQEMLS